MSDSNRVSFRYIEESSYGVALTTPTLRTLRITGEDLELVPETQTSNEILDTRETADLVMIGATVTGSLSMELSYQSCDDWFKQAIQSAAWTSAVTISGTIYSAASADNSFNRSSGDFVAAGILAGHWIRTSGFATAANNGYSVVVSVATTKLVVSQITLTNESAGASVEIEQGGCITNGSTFASMQGERVYGDVASDLVQYLGLAVNGFSMSVGAKQITTVRFPIIGKDENNLSSTFGDGSPVAAQTSKPMNGVTHARAILENGTVTKMTTWTLEVTNNLAGREVIGTFGPDSIRTGEFGCTGSMTLYYSDKALAAKLEAETETSLAIKFQDVAGNAMVFWIPRVRLTKSKRNAQAKNTDVLHEISWTALRSSTYGYTFRVARWAA